ELVAEKNKKFNTIDQVIKHQKSTETEFANEFASINTASQSKYLVIKPYIFVQEQNSPNIDCISITQQLNSEHNIVIPKMYVPDPLEFNPNSIKNVKKVLENRQNITEINQENENGY
ncbi:5814_t:CDS:2, partial [Gigaspora margarita]